MNDARQSKAALRINNTIGELTRVVDFVEAFGRRHALRAHAVNNLNLCLDELLSNTISYGYDGADPRVISLTLSLDGGYLAAEIEDDARPFDPRRRTPLPAARDIASRPIGGLGLRFVNALMEVIDYRFSDGLGLEELLDLLLVDLAVIERQPRGLAHADPEYEIQRQRDHGRGHHRRADDWRECGRRRRSDTGERFDRDADDQCEPDHQRPPHVEQPRGEDLQAVDEDEGDVEQQRRQHDGARHDREQRRQLGEGSEHDEHRADRIGDHAAGDAGGLRKTYGRRGGVGPGAACQA
jgi:serine/threonine-protein kinase RsbW